MDRGGPPVATLAVWRFEWFLLGLLAVRPLLDGLNPGEGLRVANASTSVGLVFIAASCLWLMDRRQGREWITPSPATIGLFLLVCAVALTCIVSAQPGTSVAGTLRLLSSALMFAVPEQFLAGRTDRLRQVLTAVLVATALVMVIMVWWAAQFVQGSEIDQYSGLLRLKGPFVHSNVMAKSLVVVFSCSPACRPHCGASGGWQPVGAQCSCLGRRLPGQLLAEAVADVLRQRGDEGRIRLNVLFGLMSLVGPRPPLPCEVARYGDGVHWRLLVKPGLTGLWQIRGRSDMSLNESIPCCRST